MKPSSFKFCGALLIAALLFASCGDNRPLNFKEQANGEATASLPDTNNAAERIIIKTADITLDVDQVESSVQQFQELVNHMQGHVFHYELQNEKQLQQEVQQSQDSLLQITSIQPGAMMKIRVPAQNGEPFIAAVLKMNGRIENFLFDENDVTELITEKKELMLTDARLSAEKKTTTKDRLQQIEAPTNESFIRRKADYAKMNYQSKNLWFDIRLKGKKYTIQQISARTPDLQIPFTVRAATALQNGWYGLSLLITTLLNLWPLFVIAMLLLLLIRKFPFSAFKIFKDNAGSQHRLPNTKH